MIFFLATWGYAIENVYYHPRIVNTDVGTITGCTFAFLYWYTNGAAIQIDATLKSIQLSLSYSCFKTCVTYSYGGAIYFLSENLSVYSCSWENCFVHVTIKDEMFGNCIYSTAPNTEANLSAALACGPNYQTSGDSVFHFSLKKLALFDMNTSICCSYGGPAGVQVSGLENNQVSAKYLNVVKGNANCIVTIHPKALTFTVLESNFINNTVNDKAFFVTTGLLNVNDCYIYMIDSKPLVYGTVKFLNCTGNFLYAGVNQIDYDGKFTMTKRIVEFCGYIYPESELHRANFIFGLLTHSIIQSIEDDIQTKDSLTSVRKNRKAPVRT